MAVFESTDQMYRVLGAFFDRVRFDPEIGANLKSSSLIIRFIYTNPEGQVTINFADPPAEEGAYGAYEFGESAWKPDVTFRQSADFSHRFWHGKTNVMTAIATRQIVASGSVPKALKLLPAIKPTFEVYPSVLRELGMEELVLK